MSMTRQHFEAIAEVLKSVKPAKEVRKLYTAHTKNSAAYEQWRDTVVAMATMLGNFNAGFKVARFFNACTFEAGEAE